MDHFEFVDNVAEKQINLWKKIKIYLSEDNKIK